VNGREILNAIATARQFAKSKKEDLYYRHLKHVIMITEKSGKSLDEMQQEDKN
jgi:hypothetical protein